MHQYNTSPGDELNTPTTVFAATAFIAFCLLACVAARWSFERTSVREQRLPPLMSLVTVGALVSTAFAWDPAIYRVDETLPRVCRDVDGAEVCLHQANAAALGDVTVAVKRIRDAGLAPLITKVTDRDASPGDPVQREALVYVEPGPVDPNGVAQGIQEQVALKISEAAISTTCGSGQQYDLATALLTRVMDVSGFGDMADRMGWRSDDPASQSIAGMNATELRAYIERHQGPIQSCQIQPADLAQ